MPLSYMDDVDFYPYVYYQYDSTGNITLALHGIVDNVNETIWGATTHYEYDKNRLSKVRIDGEDAKNTANSVNVSYEYYDDGKLKSVTYPALTDGSILKLEYMYDGLSRLTSITNYKGTEVLSSYLYTYDNNGNILTTTETVGATQNSVTYTYDKLNHIASVAGTKGADSYYEYDARGNRKANFEQIDFLSEESAIFVYDAEDKLVQSQVGNAPTYFEYSSNGYRYFKKENSSYPEYYIYDTNGRLQAIAAASILSNGETTISVMFPIIHYIWGPDRVLAKIDKITNTSYYYLYNGHGDVVQIVDTSGTVKNNYDYDVWGNFLKKEETIENHFTYFGQTYDETTGLYYLRARYYDPTTGRFTQQDPAEDGYNWYVYCENNAVNYIDPSGFIMIISGSNIEKTSVFNELQKLTDDRLTYEIMNMGNNRDEWIVDYINGAGHRPNGTKLVRNIIDDIHGCTIKYDASYVMSVSGWVSRNAYNGVGTSSNLYINWETVEPILTEYIDRKGNPKIEKMNIPREIALGHELIHVYRNMLGMTISNNRRTFYDYYFNGLNRETAPVDELMVVGIGHYNWIFTENMLRKELGYGKRLTY